MENGGIAEQGTYEELMKDGKAFAKLIEEYGESEEEKADDKLANEKEIDKETSKGVVTTAKTLMTTEERSTGSIDSAIYLAYMKAAGGYLLLPLLLFLLIMMG